MNMEKTTNTLVDMLFDTNTCSTLTENGAKTLITTGSKIVDQFGKAGNFRGRNITDVFEDQAVIWDENAELAIRFPFYLRMVTRKTKVSNQNVTDKVQNGQGARDESFKRLLWVAKEHPTEFYKNIWILPIVGSWKDVWTMMYYDIKERIYTINKDGMFELLANGLACDAHVDLVKKFMPRIKSAKKCKTDWTRITNSLAKKFANYLGVSVKEYNKLKASGKAHDFQKLICSRQYDKLNWGHIPGRALNLLVTSKFLDNHNLTDNYVDWIDKQPVAKFTGYVFELAHKLYSYNNCYWSGWKGVKVPYAVKHTLDAQFNGLVEKAKADGNITENVWCCLDTSGSMNQPVRGLKNTTCLDVATSLAVFFAELNTGAFHNKVIMFDHKSYPHTMVGDSFCERIMNLPSVGCGDTNFQSAIDEIIKIRTEHPEIPLEDYPTTILVVSDMQFNPSNRYSSYRDEDTNYEYSKKSLKTVFPEEFVDNMKFIWWDCASRYGNSDYEASSDEEGVSFFSGFDGSIISILLGEDAKTVDETTGKVKKLTPEEVVEKALSQEILQYITL